MHAGGAGLVTWAVIFAVIAGFYIATFSFRRISDTDLNSYQTRALALHGDIDLARFGDNIPRLSYTVRHQGSRYSIYGIGVSISAIPIYAVAARLGASDRALQAAAAIPFVAAAVVILLLLFLRLFPRVVAVGGTIIYAFGTTMWPVASMAFFQNGPVALYQTIGLTGLFGSGRRAPALAGFGFGAAALIRPTLFVPLAFAGILYLLESRRSVVLYAASALPSILIVLVQNRWIWGRWLRGGYGELDVGYHASVPSALWGLLLGWYRGMFAYSPVLIVSVFGAVIALRRVKEPFERRLLVLAVSSVVLVLVYSRFTTWFGGQNQFGYRYLLDIVPFLIILGAYGVVHSARLRTLAVGLGAVSLMAMTFGAAPSQNGFDGPVFPRGFSASSLGQAWIVFVDHPLVSIVRLLVIGLIAAGIYRWTSREPLASSARIDATSREAG